MVTGVASCFRVLSPCYAAVHAKRSESLRRHFGGNGRSTWDVQ